MEAFNRLPDSLKAAAVLMVAAAAFALAVALIKLVGIRLHVVQILFIRQLVMLLMLAPALVRDFPNAIYSNRPFLQITRVIFALIAMLAGFTAVINLPLADAMALGFAKSFFVTIAAIIVLKETVGPYRWAAVIVGFIGVAVMLRPGTAGFNLNGALAIIGAAAAGVVMVIIRLLSRTETSDSILGYQVVGIGLVMFIPALYFWLQPTAVEWLLLVSIGVVSYYAQKANIYAYAHGEASLLASLDYVRLLYATLFGYFLFDQLPSGSTWLGAAVIVIASVFTVYREAKRKQTLSRAPDGRGFGSN